MREALAVLIGLALTTGCAGAQDAPAWLAEREASAEQGFPSLHDVPRTTIANTDLAHWAALEAELKAAGAAVRANPRSVPVTAADDPALFLEQARTDLEQARQAHEPN